MTDTELQRRKAICEVAGVDDIGNLSDGFHTFNGLYEQRMILFAALVNAYKDKSWKSYRHEDGEYCFGGGWFIVGIDTPEGSYTYHYENRYWNMFDCADLPRAKHWDGHTEADAETRLMSLEPEIKTDGDTISRQAAIDAVAEMMPRSYTPDGSHPADEEIFRVQEIFADCIKTLEILPPAQPERDIPLKPIETTDRAWGIPSRQAVCPKCDYYLGHVAFLGNYKGKRVTHCETCGQAIDWEGWDFDE